MYDEENVHKDTSHMYLPPKRMNPADTIFRFIKTIKDTILGIGVGALALIKQSPMYALLFIGAFLLLMLIISFFSWMRHTYRVEDGELRVEKGIFIRKKSYISINRIHKIDFTANVLHRILKLVQVSVDTAAGGEGEVLSAVKLQDAQRLRKALKNGRSEEHPETLDEGNIQAYPNKRIHAKHLFIAGMTSGSAGFLVLGGLFLFSQVQQFIPEAAYKQGIDYLVQLSIVFIIMAIVLGFIALWMVATLGTVIKYGHFTIEKHTDELFIKRGLLETKELTIPYDRIQAIEVQQNILRKPLKYSRVIAITAGHGTDANEDNPIIFPLLPDKDVDDFLAEFVPGYEGIDEMVIPLDKKGLKYYMVKHGLLFILALIPVLYFFPVFSWIPGILGLIWIGFGWMKFRETGYRIDGRRMFTSNWQSLTRGRCVFYRHRVQSYQKYQHKLQQMENLATADFSIISLGGRATLRHLNDEDANVIGDWNSRRNSVNASHEDEVD